MGRFHVKVTQRSDEWAEENPPLEEGERSSPPDATGCEIDTPGYGPGGAVNPLGEDHDEAPGRG